MAVKTTKGFTDAERDAMQERAKELMQGKGEGEAAVLEKINKMQGLDHELAVKLHALITKTAPDLTPKTWYGMPAYANAQGQIVCFFQDSARFKSRYLTLGFSDKASLDDGSFWPVSYALTKLSAREEADIVRLVKQAVG